MNVSGVAKGVLVLNCVNLLLLIGEATLRAAEVRATGSTRGLLGRING